MIRQQLNRRKRLFTPHETTVHFFCDNPGESLTSNATLTFVRIALRRWSIKQVATFIENVVLSENSRLHTQFLEGNPSSFSILTIVLMMAIWELP